MFVEIQVYSSWFQIFGYVPLSPNALFWQFVTHFPDIPALGLKEEVALPDLLYEVCRTVSSAHTWPCLGFSTLFFLLQHLNQNFTI